VSREDTIAVEGVVVEVLRDGLVRAELSNGHQLVAHAARKHRAKVAALAPGDNVSLELSPYDMSQGRILVQAEQRIENLELIRKNDDQTEP
jgi:translation initiation factor IF-1